jgi:hypothetical protein
MTLSANGIEVNYVIEGEGPLVTMSHSLAGTRARWDEQPDEFTRVPLRFLDNATGRRPL